MHWYSARHSRRLYFLSPSLVVPLLLLSARYAPAAEAQTATRSRGGGATPTTRIAPRFPHCRRWLSFAFFTRVENSAQKSLQLVETPPLIRLRTIHSRAFASDCRCVSEDNRQAVSTCFRRITLEHPSS